MKEKLLELLNDENLDRVKLKALLPDMNTADIAESFGELEKEDIIQIFRMMPKGQAAEVFSYVDTDEQQLIIEAITDSEIGDIINRLFVDDAVDFIEEMPAGVVTRVLRNANPEKRKIINQLLQYPDDSAGSIMTTEYVDLSEDATVREAFEYIRANGVNKETIYTCYVIRQDRFLTGVISAKKLMLAKPNMRIGDIMEPNPIFAYTTGDQEAIADLFKKYGFLAMPVVDREQKLVGIITVDDIVNIIEEENTEDIEKMAALAPSDEPYLKTSVIRLAKNRIVWLLVLMLSATITGNIISGFEESLAVLPALIAFIPMLMDTGGNAGAQVSALVIRGMALGEIRLRDIMRVIWMEIRVSVLCGMALGIVNFIRIFLMNGRDVLLAFVVTASLLATVVVAKTVGCILPMVAKKIRLDPAIMAAPIITTIVDATALLIYFTIARLIFKI